MQNNSNFKFCLALVLMVMLVSLLVSSERELGQGKAEAKNDIPLIATESLIVEPEEIKEVEKAEAQPIKLFYIPEIPLSRELQEYTYDLCLEKNVDYELVLAVMWRESLFDLDAIGYNDNGTYDSGIMQINDRTKEHMGKYIDITDIYDPYQNILVGITLMSNMIGSYGEHDGLMAYAAGERGMHNLKKEKIISKYHQQILDGVQLALDKRKKFEQFKKII